MILRLNIIIAVLFNCHLFVFYLYADDDSTSTIVSNESLKIELLELEKETIRITDIFKKVFKLISPSVVRIKMRDKVSAEDNKSQDKSSPLIKSVDQQEIENVKGFNLYKTFELPDQGVGSGFIIDKNGLIVTNYHVIKEFSEKQIEITLYNNEKYIAEIVGFDPGTDLALIKIDGTQFQPVIFENDSKSETGDWVIAIGNPYGHRQTMSTGIISASGRKCTDNFPTTLTYDDFMQTDAAINPGCSGGPLVNMRGEVIGINAAIATRRGGFQGIGFAIPASIVKKVVNELIQKNGNTKETK